MNKEIECETCIKRKTMYCPNSSKCKCTENKPYYQNRIMLLEENEKLNHYKLLYQKVKERNDKGIEFISKLSSKGRDCEIYADIKREILELLKGNNEVSNEDNRMVE